MEGLKHLIQCHCILPQFKNAENPIFHQFVVFSLIDDADVVQPKFAQCNNCGVVHKVVDICKSELTTKEESQAIQSIEDIKFSLSPELVRVLESYNCDLATWEQAEWIYLTKRISDYVILARDDSKDDELHGKRLIFLEDNRFRIEAF